MEQLPLTFVQSTVEPYIEECFTPAFNFTKLSSSNGRLAFVGDKLYWLPDNPMAMLDQGWFVGVSDIAGCDKYGISGFIIRLKDGKEIRFSNVGAKMREGITAAIEAHRGNVGEVPLKDAPVEAETEKGAESEPKLDLSTKMMGVLAYLGFGVFIPLFLASESKFVRFHVNQGLILLICTFVIFSIKVFLPSLSVVVLVLYFVIVVLSIIGIVNVFRGNQKNLPLVGNIRIIAL